MAQHNLIESRKAEKRYTRTDFAALRYRLSGINLEATARVYSEDDLISRGIEDLADLNAWLKDLQAILVERAKKSNPHLAEHLENASRFNNWSPRILAHLSEAGEQDYSIPRPTDTLTEWLRPRTVAALKAEGIDSPGSLKKYVEVRGSEWFRAVPRIGQGKARALEAWIRKGEKGLGPLTIQSPAPSLYDLEVLSRSSTLLPLERISNVYSLLDGSGGLNRNQQYCLISARNDLEAIKAYLVRFDDRASTQRMYQRELERFLLWCVKFRGVAMSSALTDECEAYKAFLANPAPEWVASRNSRASPLWRPFAGPLQPQSQRYSVQILRSFFEWLVRVRYLGGNPWVTVKDPAVEGKLQALDIEKALPTDLWEKLTKIGGLLDNICSAYENTTSGRPLHGREAATQGAQYRLARAAILVIGDSGMRRAEAASASRSKLAPALPGLAGTSAMWELEVLGKRNKWRRVMLTPRAIAALRAHWLDRGHDFDGSTDYALLSPVSPGTKAARAKHLADDGETLLGNRFTPDGLYQLVRATVTRMARDSSLALTADERNTLQAVAPHALRHTFATQAAQKNLPLVVLQKLLGHESLTTTSIYTQVERKTAIDEYTKLMNNTSN